MAPVHLMEENQIRILRGCRPVQDPLIPSAFKPIKDTSLSRHSAQKESQRKKRARTPSVPQCIQNEDFPRRLEFFKRRPVLPELRINLEELRNTTVFHTVEHRGWEILVSIQGKYSWTLVVEFYASMVLDYFQQHLTVMIRGVEVSVSIDDILDYCSTWLPDNQENLLII
ncbi:hypothetical protein Ddye_008925 [Dipteronia dyeriana]|uniref:Uncharacterized protein n=1 Tax=Dipteronia dyeriana TaxID=168575 RepID=A0AAE0CME5_9ROSI|nr:hypothetical protein Ddye_008925 [Dipteronia dyeriana]